MTLDEFRARQLIEEAQYVRELIERHDWNVSSAAREAGVCNATMFSLVERHGLKRPESKARRTRNRGNAAWRALA